MVITDSELLRKFDYVPFARLDESTAKYHRSSWDHRP
jgi:hypothetical protein